MPLRRSASSPGTSPHDRVERAHHALAAVLRHHLVEAAERRVRDAPPRPEALDDAVLDRPEQRDVLRVDREVVGRGGAREERRVRGGQAVAAALRLVLDDPRRHHRAEPLANVALVEPRLARELVARRVRQAHHRVEQPRAVADRRHERRPGLVEHPDEPPAERLDHLRVRQALRRCRSSMQLFHDPPRGAVSRRGALPQPRDRRGRPKRGAARQGRSQRGGRTEVARRRACEQARRWIRSPAFSASASPRSPCGSPDPCRSVPARQRKTDALSVPRRALHDRHPTRGCPRPAPRHRPLWRLRRPRAGDPRRAGRGVDRRGPARPARRAPPRPPRRPRRRPGDALAGAPGPPRGPVRLRAARRALPGAHRLRPGPRPFAERAAASRGPRHRRLAAGPGGALRRDPRAGRAELRDPIRRRGVPSARGGRPRARPEDEREPGARLSRGRPPLRRDALGTGGLRRPRRLHAGGPGAARMGRDLAGPPGHARARRGRHPRSLA